MSDKPFNPASVVDADPVGLLDGCWPKGDPFSLDAGKWAQAFLRSGDWTRPYRAYKWFHNVIAVARAAGPIPEPED
jgi:hypothetical protein